MTTNALSFYDFSLLNETVYEDRDEWNMWKKRGDPILHIGIFNCFFYL